MSDVVGLLHELIRFDSVSARSNVAVADFCEARLRDCGFETEAIDYDDRRGVPKRSIVARRDGASAAQPLAYFGHTDVVPADEWTGPGGPFEPVVTEGRVYGRGACDMKGSVAAMLTAAEQCDAAAYVVLTADEETGFGGAKSVVAESRLYRDLLAADARGIIGEPTLGQVVCGHKGGFVWTIEATGTQRHSSFGTDDSATLRLLAVLPTLNDLVSEMQSEERFRDVRFDPPGPTPNVMLADAAPAINVTSAKATARVFVRTTPDFPAAELTDAMRRACERESVAFRAPDPSPAFFRNADDPYVRGMCERTGTKRATTVAYGTDACIFGSVPKLVVCGPGGIEQAHTKDEWIAVDELHRGVELYASLLQTV